MTDFLQSDQNHLEAILQRTLATALDFLQSLSDRPVGVTLPTLDPAQLSVNGLGTEQALALFQSHYAAGLTGSAGPRYWGFVTGGSTPAALAGDWLVSAFDQNATGATEPAASQIEKDTIRFLRQLFGLSDSHSGTFVSGATMANFVGLALGRQWVARQRGVDIAQQGLYALPPITILSGAPHASIYKALSMLGMGKHNLQSVPCLPDREAVDLVALRSALQALKGQPCILVGNAGTVNTVDFDDLESLVALKQEFNSWLHVDAAFGGFAATSPRYRHLVTGLDSADSITIDAHKWLNVPYDSAMQFTRHRDLQVEVFQNSAAYLGPIAAVGALLADPDFVHLTPENSRRLRALPAWLTLMAYGAEGQREIVERNCDLAQLLGEKIAASNQFKLLAPVRLNVVCFTLVSQPDSATIQSFLAKVRDTGQVFMTPTVYNGQPGIRAAFSNWRTQPWDVDLAWKTLEKLAI
jgi:glutamate/tyrosine decarboxylase-like PLP-dependent enzyme